MYNYLFLRICVCCHGWPHIVFAIGAKSDTCVTFAHRGPFDMRDITVCQTKCLTRVARCQYGHHAPRAPHRKACAAPVSLVSLDRAPTVAAAVARLHRVQVRSSGRLAERRTGKAPTLLALICTTFSTWVDRRYLALSMCHS